MQKRSVTPAMYRDFEENHPDVYSLLRSLGVSANHTYFFYTAYAIALVASCPLRGYYFPGKVLMPVAAAYNVPLQPSSAPSVLSQKEFSGQIRLYLPTSFLAESSHPPHNLSIHLPLIYATNTVFKWIVLHICLHRLGRFLVYFSFRRVHIFFYTYPINPHIHT